MGVYIEWLSPCLGRHRPLNCCLRSSTNHGEMRIIRLLFTVEKDDMFSFGGMTIGEGPNLGSSEQDWYVCLGTSTEYTKAEGSK